MSTPIQFRRGSNPDPEELHYVGEPIWDPLNSRLGVYNNRENKVEWYPITLDDLILNLGQMLTGKDNLNDTSTIVLDWSNPNKLVIRNKATGTVIADFSETGTTFAAAASLATGVHGSINYAINGSLSIRSTLKPIPVEGLETSAGDKQFLAPNWELWKKNNSFGSAKIKLELNEKPLAHIPAVFRVDTEGAPTNLGLRTFIHGADALIGKPFNVSAFYNGTPDASSRYRLITDNGTVVATGITVGTGDWKREELNVTVPEGTLWMAYDMLYTPGYNKSTSTWFAGGVQASIGTQPAAYETVDLVREKGRVESLFAERRNLIRSAGLFYDNLNLLPGFVPKLWATLQGQGMVNQNSADHISYSFDVVGMSTHSLLDVVAAILPDTIANV